MHIVELIIDLMLQLKIGNHFRSTVTLQGPFADVKEVTQILVVQQMLTLFLMRSMQFLINLMHDQLQFFVLSVEVFREVGRIIDEGRLKGDPATIEELRYYFNLRTGKVSPK